MLLKLRHMNVCYLRFALFNIYDSSFHACNTIQSTFMDILVSQYNSTIHRERNLFLCFSGTYTYKYIYMYCTFFSLLNSLPVYMTVFDNDYFKISASILWLFK